MQATQEPSESLAVARKCLAELQESGRKIVDKLCECFAFDAEVAYESAIEPLDEAAEAEEIELLRCWNITQAFYNKQTMTLKEWLGQRPKRQREKLEAVLKRIELYRIRCHQLPMPLKRDPQSFACVESCKREHGRYKLALFGGCLPAQAPLEHEVFNLVLEPFRWTPLTQPVELLPVDGTLACLTVLQDLRLVGLFSQNYDTSYSLVLFDTSGAETDRIELDDISPSLEGWQVIYACGNRILIAAKCLVILNQSHIEVIQALKLLTLLVVENKFVRVAQLTLNMFKELPLDRMPDWCPCRMYDNYPIDQGSSSQLILMPSEAGIGACVINPVLNQRIKNVFNWQLLPHRVGDELILHSLAPYCNSICIVVSTASDLATLRQEFEQCLKFKMFVSKRSLAVLAGGYLGISCAKNHPMLIKPFIVEDAAMNAEDDEYPTVQHIFPYRQDIFIVQKHLGPGFYDSDGTALAIDYSLQHDQRMLVRAGRVVQVFEWNA